MTVVINGTTGLSGVDGSAGTPAIQGSDTNTGVFYPAADTVAVSTGGSERLRVDSSGNVGIGTSSPAGKLDVSGNIYVSGKQITNGPAVSAYQSTSTGTASSTVFTKVTFKFSFKKISIELNNSFVSFSIFKFCIFKDIL